MPPKAAKRPVQQQQQQLNLGPQVKGRIEKSGKGPVQQRIDQNAQQRKIKEEPSIENVKPVYVEKKEVVAWKALPDGTKREVDAGRTKTVEQAEDELRLFDLDSRYGPCMSSTRLERWERAKKLKLNPPEEIMKVLKAFPEMVDRSVWHGRVHEDVKW